MSIVVLAGRATRVPQAAARAASSGQVTVIWSNPVPTGHGCWNGKRVRDLDGICAAAFALEALSRELVDLGVVQQANITAWANKGLSAEKILVEVLKHAVDPRGLVATWQRELGWLFTVRGSSVHYQSVFQPPQPHPFGINVAPTQATYTAENTARAVDLLLGILKRCRDKPKPLTQAWSKEMRGAIDQLIGSRGQSG
jgi:hypothetical protein